jgi:hypothetical protein
MYGSQFGTGQSKSLRPVHLGGSHLGQYTWVAREVGPLCRRMVTGVGSSCAQAGAPKFAHVPLPVMRWGRVRSARVDSRGARRADGAVGGRLVGSSARVTERLVRAFEGRRKELQGSEPPVGRDGGH